MNWKKIKTNIKKKAGYLIRLIEGNHNFVLNLIFFSKLIKILNTKK